MIPAKDDCPTGSRPLRDEYLVSCRGRGNAGATVAAKDKTVSKFLTYIDEMGAGDLAGLGPRDISGFLLRQRHLRRKTVASMRSSLADFLAFLAATGRTPQNLADRLPPHRYVRHESEPHLWTAEEIRGVLKSAGPLADRVRAVLARDDDYATPGKPVCDWDDAPARAGLVDALARDGMAVLGVLDGQESSPALTQAGQLLATVLGQDLDQDSDGVFAIARRVAKDRVISTVDPTGAARAQDRGPRVRWVQRAPGC